MCATRLLIYSYNIPRYFTPFENGCRNKTCGFREACKINRNGRPVCVCPRSCGRTKLPVCGLLNGKQYRNKCRLEREECKMKKNIGLIMGECKKCTHKGKKFKFGETMPDAKPCETCICQHGHWKCDIQPSCFLNNLPIKAEHPSCLVSKDGKNHVLPCPRGFSCRVPRSDNIHESFRAGVCKPKKVKRPKTVPPLVDLSRHHNRIFESEKERLNAFGFAERRMPAESEYKETSIFTERKTSTAIPSSSTPTVELRVDQQPDEGLMAHVCLAYPDKRSCSSLTSTRWYYNATARACVEFNYGGCGGNFNNFLTMEICQEVCQSGTHPTIWPSVFRYPSPVYVTSQKPVHPESGVLLDMCHDMKTGMSYRNGERWHVDACTSCSCVSGRALCVAATCPVACLNPIHVDGKCCPVCKSGVDEEIMMEGEDTRCKDTESELWYHSGESWGKDNCTKCVCFEGETSCMASVCSKPLCSNPVKKNGLCCPVCSENQEVVHLINKEENVECQDATTGKLYLPGEAWNVNDCVSCFCGKGGQQVCHKSECSIARCKNPVHLQGRCCPVCPQAFHSACMYDNRQYFQGDFMLLRDMCTLCKCNGNMWNCTKKHCNTTEKAMLASPFKTKPTAPYNTEQETTKNSKISELYINSKPTERLPTADSERSEDYIIEDPVRMTGRAIKKSINEKEKKNNVTETTKGILATMFDSRPTAAPTTTTASHIDNAHSIIYDEENIQTDKISLFGSPTEQLKNEALPWFKDFDYKMWTSWDESEYIEEVSEDKDSTDVVGMRKL